MAKLPIYTYDTAVLREKTKRIDRIDTDVIALIRNMFDTLHYASGVGLAANQVGVGRSLCVVDLSDLEKEDERHDPLVLINPVIDGINDTMVPIEEGCLSIPNIRETIERPEQIHVRYQDTNLDEREMVASGFLARVIQHEIDHLNAIFFTDHLRGIKRKLILPKLQQIKKGKYEAEYKTIDVSSARKK